MQRLDKDKKERDQQLEEDAKQRKQQQQSNLGGSDVKSHQNEVQQPKENQKSVTDPTTGRQVVIEDVNEDFMKNVDEPVLSVPNANLGKDTPVQTDSSQKNPEYKEKQDVTAPAGSGSGR